MDRYLIVTDLDGTLLNAEHSISEYDVKQIKHFKQKNGLFTFATGRMNKTVKPLIKKLHITVPVITYNGAQVFCPVKNKVLYEKSFTLSRRMYEQLIVASTSFVEVLFFYNQQVYTTKKGELIREFEEKEKVKCKRLNQVPEKVTKIIVISKDKRKLARLEYLFENRFQGISFTYSQSDYLEILPEHTSKGEALGKVKKYCAQSDLYTIGFGNQLNDISLLQASDVGVAVQNAEEQLFKIADQISKYSNNEGAVGRYIESLLTDPG